MYENENDVYRHLFGGELEQCRRQKLNAATADDFYQGRAAFKPLFVQQADADIYILDPNSAAVILWVFMVTAVTLFVSCAIPVQLAFYTYETQNNFYNILSDIVFVFFTCDILVNVNLAFEDLSSGKFVADRYRIIVEYLKFWFWMDVIATIRWDDWTWGGKASHLLSLLKLLRLVKFVQILTSHTISARVEEWAFARYRGFRVLGYLIGSLLFMHILGCGLFIVVSLEDTVSNVIIENGLEDEDVMGLWIYALLWSSQTMTTVGYGNLTLVTKPEQMYGIFVIMSGAASYAHIVGVFLEYFRTSRRKAFTHEIFLNTKDMLEAARCPKKMRKEIQRHFARSRASEMFDLKHFEDTLSRWNPTQAAKFAIQLHGKWLRRKWWLISFDPEFLFRLVMIISSRTCDPGEIIAAPGDAINTMWIVNRGFAYQAKNHCGLGVRFFCRSDVFGEEICIRTSLHYTKTYVSRSYTNFYTINRREYYELVREFPIMNKKRCMAGIFYFIRRNGGARSLYKIASLRQSTSLHDDGEW